METTNADELRQAMLRAVSQRAATDAFDYDAELRAILAPLGLTPEAAGGEIRFERLDPLMPSAVRLGEASALALVQQAVVAADIWRRRTGHGQDIAIDAGQAIRRLAPATEYTWETLNGLPPDMADRTVGVLLAPQRTKDERWVVPANIYPRLKSAMLAALGCPDNPDAMRAAIAEHTADELEELAERGGFVMAAVRTVEEFTALPVFEHLAARPLIEIEKVGESAPEPFAEFSPSPLSGVRALGMGHVIAGAGIGRSLAAYGADVLQVWRAMEWELESLVATSNVGARSTRLDLRAPGGREQMLDLLREADVLFSNRRPGLMDSVGLSLDDAIAARPGLIYTTVSTHGEDGPWAQRVGFDQAAGAVTGMLAAEGTPERPRLPPTSIVNDYLVAWLGATGTMAALARRAEEGGSYRVHVSLDRAAMWIISLGLFDPAYVASAVGSGGEHELVDPQLFRSMTPMGLYQGVTEQVRLSRTPTQYTNVLSARGADQPAWLPRPQRVDGRQMLERLRGGA